MTTLNLPFINVGTFNNRRQPNILLNEEVIDWLERHHADYQYLIGMTKDPNKWKVLFTFRTAGDAVMFKLTFGGA